ncbi:MAG: hypothetical protein GY757_29745 [bacterium]|nr:hypothetical protein [bacterium]
MKKIILSCLILFLLPGCAAELLAQYRSEYKKPRLYLKVYGSGLNADGGHFGDFVTGTEAYNAQLGSDYTATSSTRSYFQGFGGEIGIEVRKHAIGINVGYISREFSLSRLYQNSDPTPADDYYRDHTFEAIPIFLVIHYKIVETKRIKAFLTVGEGIYISTYKEELPVAAGDSGSSATSTLLLESKKNHLGLHLGATVDIKLLKPLSLSIDVGYRRIGFKELTAVDYTYLDEDGLPIESDLFYYTNESTGEVRLTTDILDEEDGWDTEPLPAAFNLNGFRLSVGLKLTL